MVSIALYHKHSDEKHLNEVKEKMKTLGAPSVRAIWSEMYGMWLSIEGCHRIRAAKELGLMPVIINVGDQKTVTYQHDGDTRKVSIKKLSQELNNCAPSTKIVDFAEEEDDED